MGEKPAPIDRFKQRAMHGYGWQLWIEELLRKENIETLVHPLRLRPDFTERSDFSDLFDLRCGPQLQCHVEVKSRGNLVWTEQGDYPYPTVFVEPLATWNRRQDSGTPHWYAMICQETEAVLWINVEKTQKYWVDERGVGGQQVLGCPVEKTSTTEEFLEWLKVETNEGSDAS